MGLNYFRTAYGKSNHKTDTHLTVPFHLESAKTLDNLIYIRRLSYLRNKNQLSEAAYSKMQSQKNSFYYIGTPHPIGNLSAIQCDLTNTITKIENLKLRIKYGSKEKKQKKYIEKKIIEHLDKTKYTTKIIEEIRKHYANATSEKERSQLKDYYVNAIHVNETVDKLKLKFLQHTPIEEIQTEIAQMVIEMGIPVQVITCKTSNLI